MNLTEETANRLIAALEEHSAALTKNTEAVTELDKAIGELSDDVDSLRGVAEELGNQLATANERG